jgi:hypothetical protein
MSRRRQLGLFCASKIIWFHGKVLRPSFSSSNLQYLLWLNRPENLAGTWQLYISSQQSKPPSASLHLLLSQLIWNLICCKNVMSAFEYDRFYWKNPGLNSVQTSLLLSIHWISKIWRGDHHNDSNYERTQSWTSMSHVHVYATAPYSCVILITHPCVQKSVKTLYTYPNVCWYISYDVVTCETLGAL